MRSLKAECLDRMIFFGEPALRRAINEFLRHHHEERNHQGIGNRLIDPGGGGRPRRRPPPLPRASRWDAAVLVPRRCIGSSLAPKSIEQPPIHRENCVFQPPPPQHADLNSRPLTENRPRRAPELRFPAPVDARPSCFTLRLVLLGEAPGEVAQHLLEDLGIVRQLGDGVRPVRVHGLSIYITRLSCTTYLYNYVIADALSFSKAGLKRRLRRAPDRSIPSSRILSSAASSSTLLPLTSGT